MQNTRPEKYFDYIQIFRGIAALMVVLHHANGSFSFYHGNHSPVLSYIATVGKFGVDFFFVLSGFIITYSSYKYKGQINQIKKYLFNRIIRIYIPYWPIGLLMLLLYWQFGSYSNAERVISLKTSLFLIPDGKPALSVAWTLVHEIIFYILFIIFFYSEKAWNIFILLWIVAIIYFLAKDVSFTNSWLSIFLSPYNLEFILGYLLAYSLKKGFKINHLSSVTGAIIFFLIFLCLVYTRFFIASFANNIIFAFGAVFLINTAVCYWNNSIRSSNIFMLLGNATYSIYLVHNPIQSAIIRILPSTENRNFLFVIEILLVLFMCCAIGLVYFLIFEKKAIKLVKNIFFRES